MRHVRPEIPSKFHRARGFEADPARISPGSRGDGAALDGVQNTTDIRERVVGSSGNEIDGREAGERTVAFLGDRRYDNVCSSTQDHPAVAMSCLCSSCGQVFSPTIIVPPSRSGVDILHRPLSQ